MCLNIFLVDHHKKSTPPVFFFPIFSGDASAPFTAPDHRLQVAEATDHLHHVEQTTQL